MIDLRPNTPNRLRDLQKGLQAQGIKIPKDAMEQIELLDHLDANPPAAIDNQDVIAGFRERKPAREIEHMAGQALARAMLTEAWAEARIKTAQQALFCLRSNGDAITKQLQALADPLIEQVTEAALIDSHDLRVLLEQGRVDDAKKVTAYPVACQSLANLYALRKAVTVGADYGATSELGQVAGWAGASCSVWRDPRLVRSTVTSDDVWREGILRGAELWFPAPDESVSQARLVIEDARDQEARAAQEAAANTPARRRRTLTRA